MISLFLGNLGFWEILLLILVIYFIFGGKNGKKKDESRKQPNINAEKSRTDKLKLPFGLN